MGCMMYKAYYRNTVDKCNKWLSCFPQFLLCSCWSPAHLLHRMLSSVTLYSFYITFTLHFFPQFDSLFPSSTFLFTLSLASASIFPLDALRDGWAAAVNLLPHQVLLMYKVEHIMVIEQERVMVHGIYILGPCVR